MTVASYRFGLRLFALIGLLTLLVFVFGLDPRSLSHWGIVFFFTSVWVEATGLSTLILLFLYEKSMGGERALHNIGSIFRQGIFLGALGTSLLLFQYLHVLAWWNSLLLFAFFLLLELTLRRLSRV